MPAKGAGQVSVCGGQPPKGGTLAEPGLVSAREQVDGPDRLREAHSAKRDQERGARVGAVTARASTPPPGGPRGRPKRHNRFVAFRAIHGSEYLGGDGEGWSLIGRISCRRVTLDSIDSETVPSGTDGCGGDGSSRNRSSIVGGGATVHAFHGCDEAVLQHGARHRREGLTRHGNKCLAMSREHAFHGRGSVTCGDGACDIHPCLPRDATGHHAIEEAFKDLGGPPVKPDARKGGREQGIVGLDPECVGWGLSVIGYRADDTSHHRRWEVIGKARQLKLSGRLEMGLPAIEDVVERCRGNRRRFPTVEDLYLAVDTGSQRNERGERGDPVGRLKRVISTKLGAVEVEQVVHRGVITIGIGRHDHISWLPSDVDERDSVSDDQRVGNADATDRSCALEAVRPHDDRNDRGVPCVIRKLDDDPTFCVTRLIGPCGEDHIVVTSALASLDDGQPVDTSLTYAVTRPSTQPAVANTEPTLDRHRTAIRENGPAPIDGGDGSGAKRGHGVPRKCWGNGRGFGGRRASAHPQRLHATNPRLCPWRFLSRQRFHPRQSGIYKRRC